MAPKSAKAAGVPAFMVLENCSNTMDRFMPSNRYEVLFVN
jgi:hypothetical protein